MIPLTIPSIETDDCQAVQEVLQSGYLVQGPRGAAFEEAIAGRVGTKHAIAVSSCTAAIHLSLLALNVRSGDMVLVTAYSWPATANAIELCGAQPVFIDILPDTFNLDPDVLRSSLDRLMAEPGTARNIKAVLPVHTFGQMADMSSITEIADRYGIPVIEDAACALGAKREGRPAGSWGRMGCFSFHPRKAVTTGEGGIITTNDEGLARKVRALRNHGQDPEATKTDFILPGFNYRLTDLQGALGLTQTAKLDRIIHSRRERAAHYDELLLNTPIRPPLVGDGAMHVYQSYVVLLPEESSSKRDAIIARMKEHGVETTIGAWDIPRTSYYRTQYKIAPDAYPVTSAVAARSLTLPLYETLKREDQEHVVEVLLRALSAS